MRCFKSKQGIILDRIDEHVGVLSKMLLNLPNPISEDQAERAVFLMERQDALISRLWNLYAKHGKQVTNRFHKEAK